MLYHLLAGSALVPETRETLLIFPPTPVKDHTERRYRYRQTHSPHLAFLAAAAVHICQLKVDRELPATLDATLSTPQHLG